MLPSVLSDFCVLICRKYNLVFNQHLAKDFTLCTLNLDLQVYIVYKILVTNCVPYSHFLMYSDQAALWDCVMLISLKIIIAILFFFLAFPCPRLTSRQLPIFPCSVFQFCLCLSRKLGLFPIFSFPSHLYHTLNPFLVLLILFLCSNLLCMPRTIFLEWLTLLVSDTDS